MSTHARTKKGLTFLVSIMLLTWFVLGGGAQIVSVWAQEPDNDNDPYDQATCAGVEEDDVENVDPHAVQDPGGKEDLGEGTSQDLGNDSDEYSPFPKNNFTPTFETGDQGINFSFEPTYTQEEKELANDAFIPEPHVNFERVGSVVPGEEVQVLVTPSGFSKEGTTGQAFYYATWLDGAYLNGHLAGGSDQALQEQTVSGGALSDCGTVGRQAAQDSDGDGMDDSWELRYGLNPNSAGDADGDLDNDGYIADAFPNAFGEPLNPAPGIEGGEIGDGVWSNLEEYIMDTDPTIADTDGDGFSDEADVVGLGQSHIHFLATKQRGEPAYELHTIVVGSTEKRDEEVKKLNKIDSAFTTIDTVSQEKLDVNLDVITPVARAGEILEVQAQPSGTQTKDLLLTYNWSVNGEPVQDQSGSGQQTLRYQVPPETRPGSEFVIDVQTINPQTGQLQRGRTTLTMGDLVLLEYDPESIEPGAAVTIHASLSGAVDASDYLFIWSLDAREQKSESKTGAADFEFIVDKRGGDHYELDLRVIEKSHSRVFGTASASLKVQAPVVTLLLSPSTPVSGDLVTVVADTAHFTSETLEYRFVIDGQESLAAGSSAALEAGQDGDFHTIEVTVAGLGTQAETARTSISFTTSVGSLSSAGGASGPSVLARVFGPNSVRGMAMLTFLATGTLGFVLTRKFVSTLA
jgi:hypothetical protein